MRVKLGKIKLENFKGIKTFDAVFDSRSAVIRAENGVGKTTIYDAYLWLMFGKDSTGRKDFGLRPLDGENQPIKGLVLAVEAEIVVNGATHTLRKEQHENVVKGQLRGYSALCKIDEATKKIGEFQEWVSNTVPEDMFKMLTDLAYFNGKLHWTDRRRALLDVAGNIDRPMGFETLLENVNGRSINDYEKILAGRKKAYVKERDEINPRIDELQKGLVDYAQTRGDSEIELQAKRENLIEKIAGLDQQRTGLLESEKQRQELIDKVNHLTCERLHRETILKNQSGPMDNLLAERADLERVHGDKTQGLVDLQTEIRRAGSEIEANGEQIAQCSDLLKTIRELFSKADEPNCPTCEQLWPEGKPKPGLADIEARGVRAKAALGEHKAKKEEWENKLNVLNNDQAAMIAVLKTAEIEKNKRIAEINITLGNKQEVDPSTDGEWKKLTTEIDKAKGEIGEPASKQLDEIEAKKKTAEEELQGLNKSLAHADTIKKSKTRIAELEAKEKELAQKIADVEAELDQIAQFKLAESKMIEATVNGMFRHTEWKLFEYFLNGEIKECCEAILKGTGVPYADMSSGQQHFCGIDVINTLSDHYGVEVPLFVDHAESMTLPIEATSQVIRLCAQVGVTELQIGVDQAAEKAVA